MKQKTVKTAKKRILKITSNGKIMMRKQSSQHLATRKSKRTKKASGQSVEVSRVNQKNIRRLVPNK
jgi:ribosomal protein L35